MNQTDVEKIIKDNNRAERQHAADQAARERGDDDNSSQLLSEEYRIGQPHERGRMLLHITEAGESR